jgi:hypothetical protein
VVNVIQDRANVIIKNVINIRNHANPDADFTKNTEQLDISGK